MSNYMYINITNIDIAMSIAVCMTMLIDVYAISN